MVEIKIRNKEIRIMSGYGPQENWPEADRLPFFLALEQEVIKAELEGKSIIIEMDSNSKLGPELIHLDPHSQSPNGKLLAGILDRHGLIVANGLKEKCVGSITRRRVTIDSIEESIIDHVILSEDLVNDLESLKVDEERVNVLTKIVKTKKGVIKTSSDHNVLISSFNILWSKKTKCDRIEMFNLKNKECQAKFKEMTSSNENLSSAFSSSDNINIYTRMFLKSLNQCVQKCFRKIRVTDKPNMEIEELFSKRRTLRNKNDPKSICELEEIERKLADMCAETNYEKIKEEIDSIKSEDGGVHYGQLWKLKKKLSPKCRDPPTAMLDKHGNLVTSEQAIEALAVETYRKRLENRVIKEDLQHVQKEKEELCKASKT